MNSSNSANQKERWKDDQTFDRTRRRSMLCTMQWQLGMCFRWIIWWSWRFRAHSVTRECLATNVLQLCDLHECWAMSIKARTWRGRQQQSMHLFHIFIAVYLHSTWSARHHRISLVGQWNPSWSVSPINPYEQVPAIVMPSPPQTMFVRHINFISLKSFISVLFGGFCFLVPYPFW